MKHFHLKPLLSTIFCFILFSSTGQQLNSSFALRNNDETIHKVETSSNLSTDNAGTLQHESSETSEGEGAHGESEGLSTLQLITLMVLLAAVFLFVNIHYIRLPSTIGLMILAIIMSIILLIGGFFFPALNESITRIMTTVDFSEVLFDIMLSFLLFAGALDINLKKLGEEKWVVLILATGGVLISTFVVGYIMFYVFGFLGLAVPLIQCLLFGALISPTDPIAVLSLVKKMGISKNLEIKIAGESLFNDGIGVVVFLTILGIANPELSGHSGGETSVGSIASLFLIEVGGGVLLGAATGVLGFQLLRLIDNAHVELEVLVTLSLVMAGTQVANFFHVSAPLAMVVLGIFLGNKGRSKFLSEVTGEYVFKFWHLVDEALNAILFILIGLQIIIISTLITTDFIIAMVIAVPVVLFARLLGVGIPVKIMAIKRKFEKNAISILTWGGLRGGISVALALSLPAYSVGNLNVTGLIMACTYMVVVFSILVQGLTIGKLVTKSMDIEETMPVETDVPGAI